MAVPGWGPVVIDLSGIDVRLADQHPGRPRLDAARHRGLRTRRRCRWASLLVAGTIAPTTEAARQIIELARSGFQFQASVGVAPSEWERVRAGDIVEVNGRTIKRRPAASRWCVRPRLKEVSIVAIGADAETSVAIAASRERRRGMS